MADKKTTIPAKKKGKTVAEVYLEIKNMIYYNMLAPGQKIIYKDLAHRLNVSITPVVQALKQLEFSKLVYYEPNKGYFVGELTESMVKEIYQVREALEIYCIPLVIKNLRKKNLKSIRDAFKQYSVATTPDAGRIQMLRDAQFHLKIAEHAGNKAIYDYLQDVFEQIYLKYKPEYLPKGRVQKALKEHHAILSALEQKDVEETKDLVKKHIQSGKKNILHNLRLSKKAFSANKLSAFMGPDAGSPLEG
jgi:DNA-binding GntR family transcriptional regulator